MFWSELCSPQGGSGRRVGAYVCEARLEERGPHPGEALAAWRALRGW